MKKCIVFLLSCFVEYYAFGACPDVCPGWNVAGENCKLCYKVTGGVYRYSCASGYYGVLSGQSAVLVSYVELSGSDITNLITKCKECPDPGRTLVSVGQTSFNQINIGNGNGWFFEKNPTINVVHNTVVSNVGENKSIMDCYIPSDDKTYIDSTGTFKFNADCGYSI